MDEQANTTIPDEQKAPNEQVPAFAEERLNTFKKRFDYVAKRLPAGVSADADTYGQLLNMNRAARRAKVSDLKRKLKRQK